jgi:hypothetical protein
MPVPPGPRRCWCIALVPFRIPPELNQAATDLGRKNRTRRVEEAKMVEKYTSKRTFCTIFDPKILVPKGKIGSFLFIFQTLTQIL